MEAYLDNSSTTRVYARVCDKMMKVMEEEYGNPSSLHMKGFRAEQCVKEAREEIARSLRVSEKEIIFTSGGTESNNMALIGGAMANRRRGNHIITSGIEHASVSNPMKFLEEQGFRVTYLPVDASGVIRMEALEEALAAGKVRKYVTDFPNEVILKAPNVIAMPHLGACTPESEDRCAEMAAQELYDYLANGNIKNSVNLPDATLSRMGVCRLCFIHRNVPRMITRILDYISDLNINVEHMINKPRGEYAYTIVDLGEKIGEETAASIRAMSDVLRVRVI